MTLENVKNGLSWKMLKKVQKPGKHLFWTWIAYQTIKGTLTTTLIWVPLLYVWSHKP